MKNNGQTQREEADRLFCARIAGYGTAAAEGQPAVLYPLFGRAGAAAGGHRAAQAAFSAGSGRFWAGFDVPQEAPARRMLGLFPDYLALSEGMDRAILEEQFPIQRWRCFPRAGCNRPSRHSGLPDGA